jgi:hypothetical protein
MVSSANTSTHPDSSAYLWMFSCSAAMVCGASELDECLECGGEGEDWEKEDDQTKKRSKASSNRRSNRALDFT